MPRCLRSLIPGGIYHVTSRGNRKEPIYLCDADRILFLEILGRVKRRRRWVVHGYCLMENHYHLVIETPEPDLSAGMQGVNSEYAQWFNRGHGFVGHVFQGRFHAGLIQSDWHFLELTGYVALNPVRAGLCETPAEWQWSSFWGMVNGAPSSLLSVGRLLAFFGREQCQARDAFRRFVEDGLTR